MSSNLLLWRPGEIKQGVCKLKGLSGVEDDFELDEGISRLDGWRDDASSAMSPRYPKDLGLADSLYGAGYLVVSAAVRKLLEEAAVARVEYLPLRIINHKGKVASADYCIVNPLAVVDCIDATASVVKENPLDPGNYSGCKQLVLRETEVPAELAVFRCLHWPAVIVVRKSLADRMTAAGLTGLHLMEPAAYTGLF
jgi:hypothetical protein